MARGAKVWWNGEFKDEAKASASLYSHGLHYGTGVFEGIRAYKQADGTGAVFRLREHIQRFHNSMKTIGYQLPFPVEQLVEACLEACRLNDFKECYIRPVAFLGDTGLGINPGDDPKIDVAILTWEWGNYLGDDGMANGVRLMTSSFVRPHVNSVMTKAKINGQYVTGVMAKREAVQNGFHEALLLDPQGYLAEGTGENVFFIKDGKVKTTPLTSILNGITRQTAMEHLRREGHNVEEQRFTRDELWFADEIFLTGTAAEITPVAEVDRRKIGIGSNAGKPGPISKKMQKDYQKIVRGEGPDYSREWLTTI